MSVDDTVSLWIDGLRRSDERSAQQLWERYFQRLVELAGRKLPPHVKRDFDEEDVALSAFYSLCEGVTKGRFPQLKDRNNLWSLLVVITARKAMHRIRDGLAEKRGGGRIRGESVFQGPGIDDDPRGIEQIIGDEPTAGFALQVSEESERLLKLLPDDSFRTLALLKMEGYTNDEAAQQLGCATRTVERRLALIRKFWIVRGESDG